MKKVFALILICALVSTVFCFSANAEGQQVAGASVTAAPGDTVDVPVTVSGNPGFMYLQIFVSVDEGLTIAGINNTGAEVAGDSFSATAVSGGYNVSMDSGNDITGDGLLFTVQVTVAEGASGTLNVNFREGNAGIFNSNEDPVEFTFVPGEVAVEAAAEAPALIMCNMDIFELNGTTLTVQGWAGANYPANNLGYQIDGGEVVFDGIEFRNFNTEEEGEIIKANAGQYAFRFASVSGGIDLSALEDGEHTVTLIVRVDGPDGNANVVMKSKTFTISHEVPAPTLVNHSFDNIIIDGDNKTPAGNAGAWIAENQNFGDVQTIGVRGWAWISSGAIGSFGYQIDEQEPVFGAQFIQNRPDLEPVLGAPMTICNGFDAENIDASGLEAGEHTFKIFVQPSGEYDPILVTSFTFTVTRPEPPVEYSLLNVSYDELKYDDNTLVNGSADKWIHGLEDPSILDFQVGTVSNITVRGWVRISEDVADIAGFGYSIDGGAVVEGDFIQDRAAELAGANFPGAQGFCIVVPVSDLAVGEHSIDAYVIAADGTEIKIVKDRSTAEVQDIRQVGVTFNVTEEVQPQPVTFVGMSFDTLWLDFIQMVDGKAGDWIAANPNFGVINVISVRGWARIANGVIESFGYAFDGAEPTFDAAYIEQRPDVQDAFGVTADEANGFFINPVYVSELSLGEHTMQIFVKATDGTVLEVTSFTFNLDKALWLCDASTGIYIPGAWMTDLSHYIDVDFDTPIDFKGFCAMFYANAQGVEVEIRLIDENGNVLETIPYSQAGDAAPTILFSKAYPAGHYKIQIQPTAINPNPDVGFGWFVLGTSLPPVTEGVQVALSGVCTIQDPTAYGVDNPDANKAPFMFLLQGVAEAVADPAVLHSMSFNTVWVDGTQICDTGDALAYLAENPIDGDISTLAFRGWAWIDNSTIESFGYSIDGGEPVFDAAFIQDRADVQDAFGVTADVANGFNIQGIDVSGLATGAHTATLYVKAADGTAVEIVEVPFNVTRPAPAYALLNVSYDELLYDGKQILSDSVYKKLVELEDPSILDFEEGTVSTIGIRGWVRISENVADIAGFGYSIDGGEVVQGEFIQDRTAELSGAGYPGGQGFIVEVPVADLAAGAHSIDVYVIAADGTQIKVVKVKNDVEYQVGVTFNVTEAAVVPIQPTNDAAIIAIAAVACVAAAGVVIGKKKLGK